MRSIDANQPEKNHENLRGDAARAKIKELVKQAPTCFFCTGVRTNAPIPARPMSVQKVDDDGSLWFLSPVDSHKNADVAVDPQVQLFFQGSAHSDFLTLSGKATLSRDRAKIRELWEPVLKTWFTEGEDDPRITVIHVVPESGYYWDTKHGRAVALAKMVAGAITGRTLDDSIEGRLRP